MADLVRSPERWAACSPEAVASGSEAQMRFFVADAKADIATLLRRLAALEAEAAERGRARLDAIVAWHGSHGTEWRRKDNGPTAKMTRPEEYVPLRALIPEAPVWEGWMPIETAPKDGNDILLLMRSDMGSNQIVASFDDEPAREGWVWQIWDGPNYHTDTFTHWRPLPAPPQDNREG